MAVGHELAEPGPMIPLNRRVAAFAITLVAAVFSVATSPPDDESDVEYAAHDSEFVLDPANPTVTKRFLVRLDTVDGGLIDAVVSAWVSGCVASEFDGGVGDGGSCMRPAGEPRPQVLVHLPGVDGGTSDRQSLFAGCVGNACEEEVAVVVSLEEGEQRALVVQLTMFLRTELANETGDEARLSITPQ